MPTLSRLRSLADLLIVFGSCFTVPTFATLSLRAARLFLRICVARDERDILPLHPAALSGEPCRDLNELIDGGELGALTPDGGDGEEWRRRGEVHKSHAARELFDE